MPDKKPIKTAIITWNQGSGDVDGLVTVEEACKALIDKEDLNDADVIVFHYQEESNQAELAASHHLLKKLQGHERIDNKYFQTRKNKWKPFQLAHVGTFVLAKESLKAIIKFKEIKQII